MYFQQFGAKYQGRREHFQLRFLGAKFIVIPLFMINRNTFICTLYIIINIFLIITSVYIPKLHPTVDVDDPVNKLHFGSESGP